MRPAGRSRSIEAVAISLVVHAVVLTVLALHAPRLRTPPDELAGPPEPIIPVLILPRVPPPEAGGPPAPIRIHQRALRTPRHELPVAPLVTPQAEPPPAPARDPGPTARTLQEEAVAANARQALRSGLVGCANPGLLSREEREKCEEGLARGARDAPFNGLGIDRDKTRDLERAGARRESDYRYKRGIPGSRPRDPNAPLDWDTQRSPPGGPSHMKGMGQGAEDLGTSLGNDRSTLKVPF
jgi:hypothetical protein